MTHNAQENPNTITFENKSGEQAVVKLIGPTHKEIGVPDGQNRTVNVVAGEYYILIRYGSDPEKYRFAKGEPFTVTQTLTKYSAITITLHKVIGGDYDTHPISKEEFEKAGGTIDGSSKSGLNTAADTPGKWSVSELGVLYPGKLKSTEGPVAADSEDLIVVLVNGLLKYTGNEQPTINESEIVLLTKRGEGSVRYEGKWQSFTIMPIKDSNGEILSGYFFHTMLVKGEVAISSIIVIKKKEEKPATITLLDNPCRLSIGFMVPKKVLGKLVFRFDNAQFDLPTSPSNGNKEQFVLEVQTQLPHRIPKNLEQGLWVSSIPIKLDVLVFPEDFSGNDFEFFKKVLSEEETPYYLGKTPIYAKLRKGKYKIVIFHSPLEEIDKSYQPKWVEKKSGEFVYRQQACPFIGSNTAYVKEGKYYWNTSREVQVDDILVTLIGLFQRNDRHFSYLLSMLPIERNFDFTMIDYLRNPLPYLKDSPTSVSLKGVPEDEIEKALEVIQRGGAFAYPISKTQYAFIEVTGEQYLYIHN